MKHLRTDEKPASSRAKTSITEISKPWIASKKTGFHNNRKIDTVVVIDVREKDEIWHFTVFFCPTSIFLPSRVMSKERILQSCHSGSTLTRARSMNKLSRSTVHESLPTEWKAGAQLLVNAYEAAKAHQIPIEQYAVSHEELSSSGLSGTAIRQMIQEDLLRSFQETTTPESSQRTFDESANLGFFPRQCFCLSESGLHC